MPVRGDFLRPPHGTNKSVVNDTQFAHVNTQNLIKHISIFDHCITWPYNQKITSIFSEKISPANDGLFVLDGLFVHEGLYVYVQLTYKKAWIF